jgi:FixJ family two-component response regulator
VVAGKLNKQIATALQVSERTVKTLRAQCMDKLGATSAAELGTLVERLRHGPQA